MPAKPPRIARAAVLAVAVLVSACGRPGSVVLGVSTNQVFVQAARLALEQELGGGGLPRIDTVLVVESTNRAAPAIERADSLVAVPGMVAVVGHSNSSASLAAAPLYNRHEVVELSPTSSAVAYAHVGAYSFSLLPPDDRQGEYLARYLEGALPGGGRVAVLYVNDDYGRGLHDALVADLDTTRFNIVVDLPHVEDDVQPAEIEETAASLAAERPDVVVWLARGAILDRYIDPIRAALPRVLIVGSDAVGARGVTMPDNPRWRGVRHVAFVDMDAAPLQPFRRAFRARFGVDATGACALTYDAVGVLLAGIRAGARTGPEMRSYLASLGRERPAYQGITGPIAFDEDGNVQRSYVMVPVNPAESP
jgi:branched-chain amino acid transport system substrate-binding protein